MTTIYTFAQNAIEEAKSAGRYGTANLYTSAINSFRKFTGNIPLTFKDLTAGLIKSYEERRCVKMPTFFLLLTKPRLSQAGALLLPKDFVCLGIRISL